jgi:hypothetical protein
MFKTILLLQLISCASSGFKETVVKTMDDKDRPSWASFEKVMYENDGKVYIVGIAEASENARLQGLSKIADNNARYEISRFINNEMGFIFQNAEEGLDQGSELSHFFGTEISKVMAHGIKTESRYYEKVLIQKPNEEPEVRTKMYSLTSIEQHTLKKLIKQSIQKQNNLSAELKAKVLDHLNSKIDTLEEKTMRWAILLLTSLPSYASWWETPHREDEKFRYYVGISDGNENLKDAMNEAYLEAIKEAVRHNYGFNHSYVESIIADLKQSEIETQSFTKQDNIHLNDIAPGRAEIAKQSPYLVYREIRYPKAAIHREKIRLQSLRSPTSFNAYKGSGENMVKFKIKTHPKDADFIITGLDNKYSKNGATDAAVYLRPGKYYLNVFKDGFQSIAEEIFVVPNASREYELKRNAIDISFKTQPSDSEILIAGRKFDPGLVELFEGQDYEVTFSHPDHYPKTEKLVFYKRSNLSHYVQLKRKPSKVSILSDPRGAKVYFNDEYVGETPLSGINFDQDVLELKIEKDGYLASSQTINIPPNKSLLPIEVNMVEFDYWKAQQEKKQRQQEVREDEKNARQEATRKKYEWSYEPFAQRGDESMFYLIPVTFEYFPSRFFSFGAGLHHATDYEQSDDCSYYCLDEEVSYSSLHVKARIYLPIGDSLRIFVGGEYGRGTKTTIDQYSNEIDETLYQGVGHNAGFKIDASESFGFNFEFRNPAPDLEIYKMYLIGVYFKI